MYLKFKPANRKFVDTQRQHKTESITSRRLGFYHKTLLHVMKALSSSQVLQENHTTDPDAVSSLTFTHRALSDVYTLQSICFIFLPFVAYHFLKFLLRFPAWLNSTSWRDWNSPSTICRLLRWFLVIWICIQYLEMD